MKVRWVEGMVRKGRGEGEANLWGGCHTDLWDKIVIKQVDDVLLLHLLGRSEFWRWRHGRAFPQLHASEHMATAQTATPKKPETGTRLAKTKKIKNTQTSWGPRRRPKQTHKQGRKKGNNHTLPREGFASLVTLRSWVGLPSAEEKRNTINMHRICHAYVIRVYATFWRTKRGYTYYNRKCWGAREGSRATPDSSTYLHVENGHTKPTWLIPTEGMLPTISNAVLIRNWVSFFMGNGLSAA